MDIEFHYFITYALARRAKFDREDASVLAYSSQYTDDNSCHYLVNGLDGNHYFSEVSQTMDISKPSVAKQTIYPVFHFMPGDPESPTALREDGSTRILNTIPGNPNAEGLLKKALESGNLYRIGIATHCYADTWAHQNFVGIKDDFNVMKGIQVVIPPIGHAQALHEPDKVHNKWKDERLAGKLKVIDNNERFIDAARNIFKAYWSRPNRTDPAKNEPWEIHWNALLPELKEAMEESFLLVFDTAARERAYGKLSDENIPSYDPKEWRHAAVEKRELEMDIFDRYWAKEGFESSHWFRFQQAVKEHREDALEILRPLYKQAGCPI